jgi:hypothetical protein
VKPLSADDSVAVCHAKVGNCQALKSKTQDNLLGFFLPVNLKNRTYLLSLNNMIFCSGYVAKLNNPELQTRAIMRDNDSICIN